MFKHARVVCAALLLSTLLAGCGGGGGSGTDVVADPTEGVVLYGTTTMYLFDETSGTIARNSEFDNFHGVIVGASRVAGRRGNALDFTTVQGAHVLFDICCYAHPDTGEGATWVDFPDNSFTVAAWLMPTEMLPGVIYPVFGGWYGSVQSMKMRVNNGTIEFLLYPPNNGDAVSLVTSSSVLQNGVWTHVAVTYNGSQAIAYIDGVPDNYGDIVMPVADIINNYFIGGIPSEHPAGPGEHSFPGVIDEVLISSESRTQQQIMDLL